MTAMAFAPPIAAVTAAIVETHLRLDEAIDATLGDLVVNTEASAVETIQRVRKLSDGTERLVGILGGGDSNGRGLGSDIAANLEHLAEVGSFIDQLPGRMERDAGNAKLIAKEIVELSTLVEAVQSISLQSQMLAINTAIQAGHAGTMGASFRVMAEEMRTLAANSKSVATLIIKGLTRTRQVIEEGLGSNISESTRELERVADAAVSIDRLRQRLEEVSGQNAERLAAIARHNEHMSRDIAEILGNLQYQDIVRQSIERVRETIAARNACILEAVRTQAPGSTPLTDVPQQLELILEQYVATESNHTRSALNSHAGSGGPKIELF